MTEAGYILNIGSGYWQMPFLHAIRDLGHQIIAVDVDPLAPGFALADVSLALSAHHPGPIFAQLAAMGLDSQVKGVLTTAARGCITTAAELADWLGVLGPGLPLKSAEIITDRLLFRSFLRERGLPSPSFRTIAGPDDIPHDLSWPVMVKPLQGTTGGAGVLRAENLTEARDAVENVRRVTTSHTGEVIVEEYLEGADVSLFGLVVEGRPRPVLLTERGVGGPTGFLPVTQFAPAAVSPEAKSRIVSLFARLAEELQVSRGPLYVEFRLTAGDLPFIIEVEPSVPANMDFLVAGTHGFSASEVAFLSLLDQPVPPFAEGAKGAAGLSMIYAPISGHLTRLSANATSSEQEPIGSITHSVLLRKRPGDIVLNESAGDACALLYAQGAERTQVVETLDWLRAQVVLEAEPVQEATSASAAQRPDADQ